MPINFFEIDESDPKYSLEKLTPMSEEMIKIFSKSYIIFQERAKFWKRSIDIAKKCMDYKRRNVFTSAQRKAYDDANKIPIETQEMKTALHALTDLIIKSVRSVTINNEDSTPPPEAPTPEVINVVLKHFETSLKTERLEYELLSDALTTGWPNWLWFDQEYEIDGIHKKIVLYHPLWESMLPEQFFKSRDGSDIKDVIKLTWVTKAALKEMNPERYKVFEKYDSNRDYDPGNISSVLHEDGEKVSSDRSRRIYDAIQTSTHNTNQGFHLLIERFFQVKKPRELYIRENPLDIVEIPMDWDEKRKNEWLNDPEHQDYRVKLNDNTKTLWVTSITDDGFVWENAQHWYQENGELPGKVYIPSVVDQIPTGPGEDMLPRVLNACASETEGLHQVLTGTGRTLHMVSGVHRDPHIVKKEMSSDTGVVRYNSKEVRANGGLGGCFKVENKTPNTTFFEHADRNRQKLREENGINDSMQGITHPRQSNKAKQTDITQGMTTQSPYVRNFNYFKLDFKNILLTLIPYQYTTEQIIKIDDDYGFEQKQSIINEQNINLYTGQAEIVANDLSKGRFIAIPSNTDDSPTNKDNERIELMDFLAAAGNSVAQYPKIFARILWSLENRFAKQLGIDLMKEVQSQEEMQAQIQQAENQKELMIEEGRRKVDYAKMNKTKKALNIKINPEDVQKNTSGAQALVDLFNK